MSEAAFSRPGLTIEEVAAAAVTSGQVELKAGLAAVAVSDAAVGEIAVWRIAGVFIVVSVGTAQPAAEAGTPVFWDSSENKASLVPVDAAGDFVMGTLAADAAAAATSLQVLLNGQAIEAASVLYAGKVVTPVAADLTLDAQDTGKVYVMSADDKTFTLPATVAGLELIMQVGAADGTAKMSVSPNASDKIMGTDVAGVDDKDYILVKATQEQGDYLHLIGNGSTGWYVKAQQGVWSQEA